MLHVEELKKCKQSLKLQFSYILEKFRLECMRIGIDDLFFDYTSLDMLAPYQPCKIIFRSKTDLNLVLLCDSLKNYFDSWYVEFDYEK